MKLSEFLETLEFHSPKKSSEYVGRKETNPVMILEENVPAWIRQTDFEDLQMSLKIFQDRVCIQGYPAIYSPQFWIANASLTAIYDVMNGFLRTPVGAENELSLSDLLFELWIKLLIAGPGSTHLHMLNIILKTRDDLLWKYMETLKGDNLKTLIRTLRTDFVYKEDVSPDHYATFMETHIDKIFRSIFSSDQFEESRRELLDLQIYYLSRMNHVPPHIGPRLSHLCFLICNRYEMENPYLGTDDWVLMRNHLKFIKDVITDSSFTKASEAQYRAPIILEKILHAAVVDKMLDVMFRDFMVMLQTITNNTNSKKCARLYTAYQAGLFEQIDLKKGFEECPYWLFKQCIEGLSQMANSTTLETHIEDFIITSQNSFLLRFTKLSATEIEQWHKLLVNYIVSGRKKLVMEAERLLTNTVLMQNCNLDWRKHVKEARMLIDIIADLPREFLQDDETSSIVQSTEAYCSFVKQLLGLLSDVEGGPGLHAEIRPNVHRCIVRCIEKDMEVKAGISLICVNSPIPDFKDLIYVREVLFSIEKLLGSEECPRGCDLLTETVSLILDSCVNTFRVKGYIAVDFNSLMMSVTLKCVTAPDLPTDLQSSTGDVFHVLCKTFVPAFVQMHCDKGSLQTIASIVFQTLSAIQEGASQGTSVRRCFDFLELMGTMSFKLLSDQEKLIIDLFIDWHCVDLKGIIKQLYDHSSAGLLGRFQDLFHLVKLIDVTDKHKVLDVIYMVSMKHAELFDENHIHTLLEIYPQETDESQAFIIQIMMALLSHNPRMLAKHADDFVDETKFSTSYFTERCTILKSLSAINEDLAVKTEDFLMKYITHRDDSIALSAMQTLVPLIKPNKWAPRKARLKVLLKSIKCSEVKTMCEELLPDGRNNDRKPVINKQKNVTETKVRSTKKPSLGKIPVKPSTPNTKVNAYPRGANTKPVKETSRPDSGGSSDITLHGISSQKQGAQNEFNWPQELEASKNRLGDTIDTVTVTRKFDNDEGLLLPSDIDKCIVHKQPLSPLPSINTEVKTDNCGGTMSRIDTDSSPVGEIPDDDSKTVPSAGLDFHNSSDDKEKVDSMNQKVMNKDGNKVTHAQKPTTELSGDTSLSVLDDPGVLEKPVCLYGSEKDKLKITAFSEVLKDAGYDNIVVFKDWDSGGSNQVVVICLSDEIQGDFLRKVMVELRDRPLIFVKMNQTAQLPGGHADKTCIRMFPKSGETILRRQWPALKFYELLMHLNYKGILPVANLLSKDFKEWWNPMKDSKASAPNNSGSGQFTQKTTSASVFFSYHWGKQKQVEPLYNYLTNQGISCWVGLQQIGGSESLYNKISQGIQECRVVLACITPQYMRTDNCRQEVNIALGLNRPVIPLLVKSDWPVRDEIADKLKQFESLKMNLTADSKIDVKANVMRTLLIYLRKYVPDISIKTDEKTITENIDQTIKPSNIHQDKIQVGDIKSQQKMLDQRATTDEKFEQKRVNQTGSGVSGKKGKQKKRNLNTISINETKSTEKESVDLFPANFESGTLTDKLKVGFRERSMSMSALKRDGNVSKMHSVTLGGDAGFQSEVHQAKSQFDVSDGVMIDEFGYTMKPNRSKSCIIL